MYRVVLISVLLISGCATMKPYPVCFYDSRAPDIAIQKEHVSSLETVLKNSASNVSVSHDGRWIIAKTTWYQHRNLSKMWPRISCIGRVTSGTEVKQYQDCIYYIEELLETQDYSTLDVKNNVTDSDEAPGKEHVICSRKP